MTPQLPVCRHRPCDADRHHVQLGLSVGIVKTCVLIENVFAVFQLDEILYELRAHSAGLNCGIWDYSASFISKLGQWAATCRSVSRDAPVSEPRRAGQWAATRRSVSRDAPVSEPRRAGQWAATCRSVSRDAPVSEPRRAGQWAATLMGQSYVGQS